MSVSLFKTMVCALVCSLPVLAGQWEPVWSDEFNVNGAPDAGAWSYDVGGNGWGNNELQYYTDNRRENARVENGHLIVEARREAYEGKEYTSARLLSKNSWLYGRLEIRAQIPSGKGTWPAIWMLPTDWAYGGWPASGELDIMEHVGYDQGRVYTTIHCAAYNGAAGTQRGGNAVYGDVSSAYHVYAMEWNAENVSFFIDDAKIYSYDNPHGGSTVWPYDKQFHLILNVAFGGNWGGAQGIDPGCMPASMLIDYVRVFSWNENSTSTVDLDLSSSDGGEAFADPAGPTFTSGTNVSLSANPEDGMVFARWLGDVSGKQNSVSLGMDANKVVTALFRPETSLVINGGFDNDGLAWDAVQNGGAMSTSIVDGALSCAISNGGADPWSVHMQQALVDLPAGKSLTLSFRAKASAARTLNAGVGQNADPYLLYGGETVDLSTQWQSYSIEFTPTSSDAAARVVFDMGTAGGAVSLDDVVLSATPTTATVQASAFSLKPSCMLSGGVLHLSGYFGATQAELRDLRGRLVCTAPVRNGKAGMAVGGIAAGSYLLSVNAGISRSILIQ